MSNKPARGASTILLEAYITSLIPWETRIRGALQRRTVVVQRPLLPPRDLALAGPLLAW